MTITAVLNHENYQTVIHNKQHTIISDEPTHLGGNDTGMSPMAIMASSLASCTLITMKMYAKRKGWNISQLEVSIKK